MKEWLLFILMKALEVLRYFLRSLLRGQLVEDLVVERDPRHKLHGLDGGLYRIMMERIQEGLLVRGGSKIFPIMDNR